jgi:hypothetical protein
MTMIWERLCECLPYSSSASLCLKLMRFCVVRIYTGHGSLFLTVGSQRGLSHLLTSSRSGSWKRRKSTQTVSECCFPLYSNYCSLIRNSQSFDVGPQVGDQEWVRGNAAMRVSDSSLPLWLSLPSPLLNRVMFCAGIGQDWTSSARYSRP